ncbi:MAG: radical SAM protein [Bacteroidales bacterium]|nr:radical SAM protein [Bacteroidales bacterium]
MISFQPSYIETYEKSILKERKEQAFEQLKNCHLCPRNCGVDRTVGETGICKTGVRAVVASYAPHYGEEAPLVGRYGSGTIFLTHCNLLCNFCQNYDISHEGSGIEVSKSNLARMMLELQQMGCHNINFVTPSHVIPQILAALEIAIKNGLDIPLVYNTSGYDHVESLQLLNGIFDIYMPDFKFWDPKVAEETCNAPDYPDKVKVAIKEMHRQVGDLEIVDGIAKKGLLVRHLVMPNDLADTKEIMHFLAENISLNTYVNIMPQYRPYGNVFDNTDLSRSITNEEYENAIEFAKMAGLSRFD